MLTDCIRLPLRRAVLDSPPRERFSSRQVLRVMAMTGAGLEQEGALEAGVAAIASIAGMQGLPRGEAPVANLMTQMVKAMGSIACLSEVE